MNNIKTKEELRAMRKLMFEEMEEKLRAGKSPEDSLFYFFEELAASRHLGEHTGGRRKKGLVAKA